MTVIIDGTTGINKVQDSTISAAKLDGEQTGTAPVFGARAWAVFDGTLTGTNAPLASGNVTSITRNGVGDYSVTFTTPMPDINYAVTAVCNSTASYANVMTTVVFVNRTGTTLEAPTVNGFRLATTSSNDGAGRDVSKVCIAVYR